MEKMKENDTFSVTPIRKYKSPQYPTYDDARGDSKLLKKLPSRWKKNAKVLACLGLIGTFALVSHAESLAGDAEANGYGENNAYYLKAGGGSFDVTVRMHHGGAGFPFYVVYLTEQEALNIIRTEAEAAGLRFDSVPPDYTVNIMRAILGDNARDRPGMDIRLDLFDEEKNVAFVYLDGGPLRHLFQRRLAIRPLIENPERQITEGFAEHNEDISVGVFIDRGTWPRGKLVDGKLTDETRTETGRILAENLTAQVREFIESLRAQGIL